MGGGLVVVVELVCIACNRNNVQNYKEVLKNFFLRLSLGKEETLFCIKMASQAPLHSHWLMCRIE